MPSAADLAVRLRMLATDEQRMKYRRFFPGDDTFIGVRMGDVFALARTALTLPVAELETLLASDTHEDRVLACSIMGKAARSRQAELFDLYRRRHDRIDTWDLVDLVAYQLAGSWLTDKPRDPLYDWAADGFWPARRSAIVATAAFLRQGETGDTLAISRLLVADPEVFVQKGVGWMLRTAGDADRAALLAFLDEHAAGMPRPMLGAAIEKLPKPDRDRYRAAR
jgi:3-methyladenine DNA glycosylase AlkD